MEVLFQLIGYIFFIGLGYVVGYLPVLLCSLGSVEPGPLDRVEDYSYYRDKGEKWWHVTYMDGDQRYLPAEAVALVGWLFIGAFVGMVWLLVKLVT